MTIVTALRPGRVRADSRLRREHAMTQAVTQAVTQARESQADLARARAAARDMRNMRDSRVASELARHLRGLS